MSEARRRAIVEIAVRHDLIVVEDDVYGHLPNDRPPPIAALAPERTVYITAASKIVAPNLRFGVLIAPDRLFDRLADTQSALFLTCPALLAALFTQWLEDGTADDLIRRQRSEIAARQAIAAACLDAIPHRTAPLSYNVWLPLPEPWRSSTFTSALIARGVAVDPCLSLRRRPGARAARHPHQLERRQNPGTTPPRPRYRARHPDVRTDRAQGHHIGERDRLRAGVGASGL